MKLIFHLIGVLLSIALSTKVCAQVMIDDSTTSYSLNEHLYFNKGFRLFGNFQELLADLRETPLRRSMQKTNNLSLGISYYTYILSIPLQNATEKEVELELVIPNPNIRRISFYQANSGDSLIRFYRAGTEFAFSVRPVLNRNFIFPFVLRARERNTLYLKIAVPDAFFFAPVLLNKEGVFQKKDMTCFIFYIFFTCIMMFIIIISLVIAAVYEGVLFLLYATYIFFSTLFFLSNEGLDSQFFYPELPDLVFTSNPRMYASIALLALLQFSLTFFKTKRPSRFLTFSLNTWRIAMFATFIFLSVLHMSNVEWSPFPHFQISYTDLFYIVFIISTWLLIVALIIFKKIKRKANAGLFLLSISGLMVTVTYTLFYSVGIIHKIYTPVNPMPLSFSFEIVFLSVALVYRSKIIENKKKRLESALQEELKNSAGKQISIQELERSRIARDLHDEIGSNLASMKIQVEQMESRDTETGKQIATLIDVINNSTKSLHHITHNLMPPSFDIAPFPVVLDKFFEKIKLNPRIYFEFYIYSYTEIFSKEVELIIYRIIMELTHNIYKHSAASSASIQLIYTEHFLHIVAEDNGIGIDDHRSTGFGLKNVESRVRYLNGTLKTDSSKKGTLISINIPYKTNKYENETPVV